MREAVRGLAGRCPVCVVSGRDRSVVQRLMGLEDLVVAASHGFDIWAPRTGTISHDAATGFGDLLSRVTQRLRAGVEPCHGASVEVKQASVAVHYRLVGEEEHRYVQSVVEALLADHPDELKVTPGKMVYEIQPKLDWHKGKAVLFLLRTLGLDGDEIVPLYIGDDITDEDAFRALAGRGIGIVVAGDPPDTDRTTAADFMLDSTGDVELFLNTLAR
ncbi:MAG: trehalose-phosphatase, partial [Pseudonocardiaceae bacterium]